MVPVYFALLKTCQKHPLRMRISCFESILKDVLDSETLKNLEIVVSTVKIKHFLKLIAISLL